MNFNIGDKVFLHWTIAERIGSGAYGTVYKLEREEFGEKYFSALKVIQIPPNSDYISTLKSEGMSNNDISEYIGDIAKSFMNEIKLLEELKGNSNIVSYEDHIIESDNNFEYTIMIRMELLTPLKNRLVESELNEVEIAKLGLDICDALELCESKNIIHRDIKPDNIFVANIGTYKLGDFGVARTMEKTISAMSQKGTYTYMAPEIYTGREYDKTVDLYSLAIVLYQLLNKNRTPFLPPAPQPIKYSDRENAQRRRMSGETVPPIDSINNKWNHFFEVALAFDPQKRFKNASEMRNALKEILSPSVQVNKNNVYKAETANKSDAKNNVELDIDEPTKSSTLASISTLKDKKRLFADKKVKGKKTSFCTAMRIVCLIVMAISSAFIAESIDYMFYFPRIIHCFFLAVAVIILLILIINKFKDSLPKTVSFALEGAGTIILFLGFNAIEFVEYIYWDLFRYVFWDFSLEVVTLIVALSAILALVLYVVFSNKSRGAEK